MDDLYARRFQILFATQMVALFGSLVLPANFFELTVLPIFFWLNMAAAILVCSKNKPAMIIVSLLALVSIALNVLDHSFRGGAALNFSQALIYLVLYSILIWQIIAQLWNSSTISTNVIYGSMVGYISLGILAFLLFMSIELAAPGSFVRTFPLGTNLGDTEDLILYFSFISLLTVGYGDVAPMTPIAQKATMFTGLMGHFYTVIVTAIIVGKFIQSNIENEIESEIKSDAADRPKKKRGLFFTRNKF